MSDEQPAAADRAGWWGPYSIEPHQAALWSIDALRLRVLRSDQEWRLASSWEPDAAEEGWTVDLDAEMPDDADGIQRHVFSHTVGPLRLSPALADRPVVASPRIPLYLPPGENVTVYVGSPLWVRIEVEQPSVAIGEVAVRRPSDTWFGPSTREGELCYAVRTRAIVDAANVETLARRAITPVVIENHADGPLPVERLKLPVPFLSVHAAGDGQLWTPTVTMVTQAEAGMATFDVGSEPPPDVRAELLTPARETPEPGLLIRAFSLFHPFEDENR